MRHRNRALFCSASVLAVALSGQASAQDAPPPPATSDQARPETVSQLDEVVVTARRKSESLLSVPAAVTAVSSETLTSQGVTDLRGLAGAIPNVNIQGATTSATSAQVFMRGIGIDPPLYGTDGAIGIYLNDVYIGRPAGTLTGGTLDLERIEVLRGPQGTLYGRNSVAGAIKLVTKAPDLEDYSGQLAATIGSEERRDLRGIVNVPIIQGELGLRIAAQTRDSDGYYRLVNASGALTGEKANATHGQDIRATLLWEKSPTFSLTLQADYSRDRSGPQVNSAINCLGLNPQTQDCPLFYGEPFVGYYGFAPNTNRFNGGGVSAVAVWEPFENLTVKSTTAYREFRDVFSTTLNGRPPGTNILQDLNQNQFQQEINATSSFSGMFNFAAGVFYYKESIHAPTNINSVVFNVDEQDSESTAIYGELYIEPIDKLEITLGGRYSWDNRTIDRALRLGSATANPSLYSAELEEGIFTPKVGIRYNTGRYMLYANYAQGYRPPGWATSTPSNAGSQRTTYVTETEDSYEIGAHASLFDRMLTLNVAAFKANYDNLQTNITDAAGVTQVTSNDARIEGFEGEFTLRPPIDGLTITGNLGLLETSYASPPVANPLAKELKHAPHVTSQLAVNYERILGDIPGSFFIAGDWSHTSDAFRSFSNSEAHHSPAFDLFSGRVGYHSADDAWSVIIGGTNLSDETYFLIGGGANVSRAYSAPRRFFATLQVNF